MSLFGALGSHRKNALWLVDRLCVLLNLRVAQGVEGPEGGGGDATQTAGGHDEAGAEAAGAGQTEGHGGLPVTGGVFFLLTLLFCDLNHSTHVSFAICQQEDAKNFVTLENLDQRIEEALDNPKSYNFAIDKEGRVVRRTVLQ